MPIKLVIFDLDGVLIDSREVHYLALNRALGDRYAISPEEHEAKYDGLSTKTKLKMLSVDKGLPESFHEQINADKQRFTYELLEMHLPKPDVRLVEVMEYIQSQGVQIHVASNCIRKTVDVALCTIGVSGYISHSICNEDVKASKPSPDMYLKSMLKAGACPNETVIFEDSPIGLRAAKASGAYVCPVFHPTCVDVSLLQRVFKRFQENTLGATQMVHETAIDNLTILIPMSGEGSRFAKTGRSEYQKPKPLIDVHGKPMIERVVENLQLKPSKYIFIVRQSHEDKHRVSEVLNRIAPGCTIVYTPGLTEGAACSVLLAKEHINNDDQLIIANSDQIVDWDAYSFLHHAQGEDGCIATFHDTDKKWSFAKVNEKGLVTEVREKVPIPGSDLATCGIYYFKRGCDFVAAAEQMIQKNIRTNREYYLAPAYNEAILNGLKISTFDVHRMTGIGVPEDLETYLQSVSPTAE